jgi:hypothetical protein
MRQQNQFRATTMIEPNFPVHEGLDRFEQDLKSLTPKHFPVELPALPPTGPSWLKIASVSWLMGLAAGVLVSAIWARLMNGQVPIAEPNLVSQKVGLNPNPPSTNPFGSQSTRAFGVETLAVRSRTIAADLDDDYILQPLMRRNTVHASRWFSGVDVANRPRSSQTDAAHSSAEDSAIPDPDSFPKHQGQRQLLKMLMESDDLISI